MTRSPCGGFATHMLALLGHEVVRVAGPSGDPVLDREVYHRLKKPSLAHRPSEQQLSEFDVVVVDQWSVNSSEGGMAIVARLEEAQATSLVVYLADVAVDGDVASSVATGFVIDHAIGSSDGIPSGTPYGRSYSGPPLPFPGRATDHDAASQVAIAVLAWDGRRGRVDVCATQAALVTNRYWVDQWFVEPELCADRNYHEGIPAGGILECEDGFLELVIFTESAWWALAKWMGSPPWSLDPEFPTRRYIDDRRDVLQSALAGWASHRTTDDILKLADRDGVPAARFVSLAEALHDESAARAGYVGDCGGVVIPVTPYWSPGQAGATVPPPTPVMPTPVDVEPLKGVVVVDFTVAQAGAQASWLLAHLGAAVVKPERRDRPDLTRLWSPGSLDASYAYLEGNSGKQSMLIQWDRPEGMSLLKELIAGADVFVTNSRPAVLQRLGLSFTDLLEINPRIAYASVSTQGHEDPSRRDRPGYAPIFGAASGVSSAITPDDWPPSELAGWADFAVGNLAAVAALHALAEARARGRGIWIDTSAIAALSFLVCDRAWELQTGHEPPVSRGLLRCLDGIVAFDTLTSDGAMPPGDYPMLSEAEAVNRLREGRVAAAGLRTVEEVARMRLGFAINPYWELEVNPALGYARRTIHPPWSVGGEVVGTRVDGAWLGEHSTQVASEILHLADEEIDRLTSLGVLG